MNPALAIEGLTYAYGPKVALRDVTFAVEAGQFCALLGPNGAGKSTLFSLLVRLLVARQGRIGVAGHDMARAPRAALAAMGVVFQRPTLDLDMTVLGNMRYFAALHGLSGRTAQQRIEAALEQLEMAERADELVRALNGGHRRRMEIARALIHAPRILLLDEPTVGLDAQSRRAITAHVHRLADDGVAVLWATHLVDEIAPEDAVVVLHQGEVLARQLAGELSGARPLADVFLEMTGAGQGA
ncbi:MAG: ABC transporter ATP-binding protein [Pseudomonadota bacterium]